MVPITDKHTENLDRIVEGPKDHQVPTDKYYQIYYCLGMCSIKCIASVTGSRVTSICDECSR